MEKPDIESNKEQRDSAEIVPGVKEDFPIWASVEIGKFQNVEALQEAIKAKGSEAGRGIGENIAGGDWNEHDVAMILTHDSDFSLSTEVQTFDLVAVKAEDLVPYDDNKGSEPHSHYHEKYNHNLYEAVCEEAKKRGLELCPPEVGPDLYLQGVNEEVGIGMKPIFAAHTFAYECIFMVSPNLLGVYHNGPRIERRTKLVFVKPRQ